jgi:hypothetical protein
VRQGDVLHLRRIHDVDRAGAAPRPKRSIHHSRASPPPATTSFSGWIRPVCARSFWERRTPMRSTR